MRRKIITLLLLAETFVLSAQNTAVEKEALYYIRDAYNHRNEVDKTHAIKQLKAFESYLSGNLKPENVSDSTSYYYANTVASLISYLDNSERESPGESINWETVYTYQIKQAERGNINAQANVGNLYYYKKDYVKAAEWYRKAAEQGNANSQFFLGWMYRQGYGITKNNVEAAKWYHKAAEQGHALAQTNLGFLYSEGYGVTQNKAEALHWYRKSAEQGESMGQNNLGSMYLKGSGVAIDYTEAIKWYRKSAEQGNATGQFSLGFMYYSGYGVSKEIGRAHV